MCRCGSKRPWIRTNSSAHVFFVEWCKPQRFCDFVGAVLGKSASVYTAITCSRREDVGMTGARELELMGLLAPHIRRAVTIHGIIDRNAARAADFAASLDLVPG